VFLFAAVILMLPASAGARWSLHKLVELQHVDHHAEWEADGCPEGLWYFGKLPKFWGPARTEWLAWKWLFSTPAWARQDTEALRLLRRYRLCAAIGFPLVVAGVVAQALLG